MVLVAAVCCGAVYVESRVVDQYHHYPRWVCAEVVVVHCPPVTDLNVETLEIVLEKSSPEYFAV
jgi:hypothetical protein